jgi:hypothetical protein
MDAVSGWHEGGQYMVDQKTQAAQAQSGYSASEANRDNQKQNAVPTGRKPAEGKDPMAGQSAAQQDDSPGGDKDTPI